MKLTCNPTCLGMDNIWCSPRVSSIRMLGGGHDEPRCVVGG